MRYNLESIQKVVVLMALIQYGVDSDGNPNVFNVEHDDNERWLNTNWTNPTNQWNPENVWVFLRSNPLISLPALRWESFVSGVVRTIRRAYGLSHQAVRIVQ